MRLWLQVRDKRLIIAYRVLCGALNVSAQTVLLFQNDFSNRLGILFLALASFYICVELVFNKTSNYVFSYFLTQQSHVKGDSKLS